VTCARLWRGLQLRTSRGHALSCGAQRAHEGAGAQGARRTATATSTGSTPSDGAPRVHESPGAPRARRTASATSTGSALSHGAPRMHECPGAPRPQRNARPLARVSKAQTRDCVPRLFWEQLHPLQCCSQKADAFYFAPLHIFQTPNSPCPRCTETFSSARNLESQCAPPGCPPAVAVLRALGAPERTRARETSNLSALPPIVRLGL
jgi:hypothetical protein